MDKLRPEIERLKSFVEKQEPSMRAFALKANINPATLRNVIRGRNSFGMDTLQKIKVAYPALDLDWIIMGITQKSSNVSIIEVANEPKSDYNSTNGVYLKSENKNLRQKLEQQEQKEQLLRDNIKSLKETIDIQKTLIDALKKQNE